ncbi:MAG: hypothetical protein ABIG70_09840 [Pseudomonadota bacterium]
MIISNLAFAYDSNKRAFRRISYEIRPFAENSKLQDSALDVVFREIVEPMILTLLPPGQQGKETECVFDKWGIRKVIHYQIGKRSFWRPFKSAGCYIEATLMEDMGNPRKSSIEIVHHGDAFSHHEFLFNSLLGIEGLQIDEFAQSAHDKIAIIFGHPDGDAEALANSFRVAAMLNREK